jgi:hypothetical protein
MLKIGRRENCPCYIQEKYQKNQVFHKYNNLTHILNSNI